MEMASSGGASSSLPKCQLALVVGTPVVLGFGYMYCRNCVNKPGEKPERGDPKRLRISGEKQVSVDGSELPSKLGNLANKGEDPPYLSVGTEVSGKYKGAFCETKIRKVVRSVKCRVTYKQGLGTATVADDQIKGILRVGASVEARHNDRKDFVKDTITKIQDCSQYTIVFDDGDITTLRRTALCLKSGRHFTESETLDQLPLTHPEHFGNPVIGGRRGGRSRETQKDSSDDDDDGPRGSNALGSISGSKEGPETEPEIDRVVCVELGDKKKKDNWFPGLVVAPTAQDTVRIRVRDDYLVRSFKDARY